jgi:hypothetical protein
MDPLFLAKLSKVIVIGLMIAVVYSLGTALYYLMHDEDDSARRLKALKRRLFFSALLIVYLVFAYSQGWIQPHGLMP